MQGRTAGWTEESVGGWSSDNMACLENESPCEETIRHFNWISELQIHSSVCFLSAVFYMICLKVATLALYLIAASGRAGKGQVGVPSSGSGSNGGNALKRFSP